MVLRDTLCQEASFSVLQLSQESLSDHAVLLKPVSSVIQLALGPTEEIFDALID